MIREHIEKHGYTVMQERRYEMGMVKLAGTLQHMAFLQESYMIRLLTNAQIKKGRAYTFKQLRQIAQPDSAADHFQQQIHTLAGKRILLRGYTLNCPECHLQTWYDLDQVAEYVTCQGCNTTFQIPLELDFAHRLNPLYSEGLNQGALSVLLATLWLYQHARYKDFFRWETGYTLTRDGHSTEVDLITRDGDRMMLVECKDNVDDPAQTNAQLDRLRGIAHTLDAEARFATLQPINPPGITTIHLDSST